MSERRAEGCDIRCIRIEFSFLNVYTLFELKAMDSVELIESGLDNLESHYELHDRSAVVRQDESDRTTSKWI